jgi:homocysteine S-methyltransferase
LSNYPNATPVFDVDAIGLTNMVTNLNTGIDLGGQAIGPPTGFWVFVALNPTAINPEKEILRLQSKVDAGAHATVTQPVFDVEQLFRFLDDIPEGYRVPVVAGIWPLSSLRNAEFLANEVPGVSVPDRVLARMASAREKNAEKEEGVKIAVDILEQVSDRVQGIQVAAPFGRIKSAVKVLEASRRIKGAS